MSKVIRCNQTQLLYGPLDGLIYEGLDVEKSLPDRIYLVVGLVKWNTVGVIDRFHCVPKTHLETIMVYERRQIGEMYGSPVKELHKHYFIGHLLPGSLDVYECSQRKEKQK